MPRKQTKGDEAMETPQNTLYINNINEKVKKDVLKKTLCMLFSQYGRVVQIVACKGIKMRGQDANAATNALKGKQGFNFYDKPLKIQFAKEKSHVIARKEGTEIVRAPKRRREPEEDAVAAEPVAPPPKEPRLMVNNTPHRILFAQNLPGEVTQEMLTAIFQMSPGFQEARLAPGGRGLAFIEFENEVQSSMALRQLNGMQLTQTAVLRLTYSN